MKTSIRTFVSTIFLLLLNTSIFSQAPVRDRWDTICASVTYTYQLNEQFSIRQNNNLPFNNNILIYGDSVHEYLNNVCSSYIQILNPTTSSLATINYTRQADDYGTAAAAVIQTNTANLSYAFFGSNLNTNLLTDHSIVYKLNSQTNVVTSETFTFVAPNYNYGILNMAFFSPSSNHDSLIIFNHSKLGTDSVNIFKKHYNQVGFINSHVKLPLPVDEINKVFNFNNVLYIAGRLSGQNYLFNSTDGTTFTLNTNYPYMTAGVIDMDTLNNQLYIGVYDSDGFYSITRTPDGVNFTPLVNGSFGKLTSLKKHDNKIWYSVRDFNTYFNGKPIVKYLSSPSYTTETLSIDTIGRRYNDANYFKLQKLGNKLFLGGTYLNYSDIIFGTFFYQFIPPVASFSISTSQICMSTPYTYTNQSLNSDSVRWFIDTQFNTSTSNVLSATFTSTGTHTIGLIAISGTQKDTMIHIVNVYSVTVNLNNSLSGCVHNTTTIVPTTPGAIAPISYTWSVASGLSSSSISGPTIGVSANSSGTYSYMLVVSDVNGCGAYGAVGNLTVNSSKDITGIASVSSNPLSTGNIILYKYEPFLTKFDSVTFQPLNALGGFTFSITDANTYIIKCEPSASSLQITYAPSEISWKTAAHVIHGCINNTNQNIDVIPLTNIGTGPGVLAGKITEGAGYGNRTTSPGAPIGGLNIKGGKNPGGNIVSQGRTNSAGDYTLSGLPLTGVGEEYFVLVDVAGLDTNTTYHVAITTASLQYTNLNFIVDSAKITPIQNVGIQQYKLNNGNIKVYPNPTRNFVNIDLKLLKPEAVEITLNDIAGKEVKTILPSTFNFNTDLKIQTQLGDLNSGAYLLKIKIGEETRTIKLILTN